jgi:hypothetical protein
VISSSQRPLLDNTQHSQETDIHALGGIRTHNLSKRAAADLALDRAAAVTGKLSIRVFQICGLGMSERVLVCVSSNTYGKIILYVFLATI